MILFLKTGAIWMPVKIKMPCLFCNATWKDIGYGSIDSSWKYKRTSDLGDTGPKQLKYEKDWTLEFCGLCESRW